MTHSYTSSCFHPPSVNSYRPTHSHTTVHSQIHHPSVHKTYVYFQPVMICLICKYILYKLHAGFGKAEETFKNGSILTRHSRLFQRQRPPPNHHHHHHHHRRRRRCHRRRGLNRMSMKKTAAADLPRAGRSL